MSRATITDTDTSHHNHPRGTLSSVIAFNLPQMMRTAAHECPELKDLHRQGSEALRRIVLLDAEFAAETYTAKVLEETA